MKTTLAFDVYGTLIDTHGVIETLKKHIGDMAPSFSQTWRDKQLEYSFRRGLMAKYVDFGVCTSQALDYTCGYYELELSDQIKEELLGVYRMLPAFPDVEIGLHQLKTAGFSLYAFSNGKEEALEQLLSNAGIRDLFIGLVSVDDIKVFKPAPATYTHFLQKAETVSGNAWLISSNPFDVIGARSAGMHAAWVQRSSKALFDPWGIEPTLTVSDLAELAEKLSQANSAQEK